MHRPPPAPVVRYGDEPSHIANLHLPVGHPRFPAVALVHGGFWRDRWDRTLMTPLANDLAARGYAAWNVEYRRVGPEGGSWPVARDDVVAALVHLATLPEVDTSGLVVIGHSAGAHLALCAAASRTVPIALVVAQAGLCDLDRARQLDAQAVDAFVGGSPADVPERYAEASPRSLLPVGTPQLLVHGSEDDVVPAEMTEAYAAAARAAGDAVEHVVVAGADHFDVIAADHAAWQVVVERLERLRSDRRSDASQ